MDKSAAKNAYKQAKPDMGVYKIATHQNDKIYIGFSTDLPAKLNRHRAELRFGSHRNRELQELWDRFGEAALEFEVIDRLDHEKSAQAKPDEELKLLADMWADKIAKSGGRVVRI